MISESSNVKGVYQPGTASESQKTWDGMYRAKVVEVDIDGNDYGAVRVFIPDLFVKEFMENDDFDENKNGLIAYPANNPMGGYNTDDTDEESFYQASVCVPRKNSWVWIFFEAGDPSKPYYFAAMMNKNSKLPPENRGVAEPHKVVTWKSGSGRAIVMSDSDDCQRIEITGKKRTMSGGPAGEGSVYDIDGNMTTILLDERDGGEKFLIKSHKGDFFKLDVENRKLEIDMESDVIIKTRGKIQMDAEQGLLLNSNGGPMTQKSKGNVSLKSEGDIFINSSSGNIHIKGGVNVYIDADATVITQTKMAQPAVDPVIDEIDGSR